MNASVHCIVAGQQVSAAKCIDEQLSNRCWCPRAVMAINEFEPTVAPGTDTTEVEGKKRRMREELVILKGRCAGMLRKTGNQRYAGPALRAVNGVVAPQPLFAGDLPPPPSAEEERLEPPQPVYAVPVGLDAPPRRVVPDIDESELAREEKIAEQEEEAKLPRPVNAPAVCSWPSCRTALRANNLSNLCRLHRNKVTSRQREKLIPEVVRAAGTAREAMKAGVRICAVDGCGKALGKHTKGDKCVPCLKGIKPGGGLVPCATPGCKSKTQRLVSDKCALCRQGKKWQLEAPRAMRKDSPEVEMGDRHSRGVCSCGKLIRMGRDGVVHDKCRRCREKAGQAVAPARMKKTPRLVLNSKSAPSPHGNAPVDVIEETSPERFHGLPAIENLPPAYLLACVRHLHTMRRQIEFALAGEPFFPRDKAANG